MPSHAAAVLPEPGPVARAHSERVAGAVRERIARAGGWISFTDYMQIALYAPGLGYYVAGARKFGAAGDFVTAPETTPLFGQALATQVAAILGATRGREVVELGAGSGRLAADLLRALDGAKSAPSRYRILEVSPELRERQRATIVRDVPGLAPRVEWLDALPEAIDGAVLMNEVLDAIPPHLVGRRGGEWLERGVSCSADGSFRFEDRPLADARVRALAQDRFPPGSALPRAREGDSRFALPRARPAGSGSPLPRARAHDLGSPLPRAGEGSGVRADAEDDYLSEINPAAEALVEDVGSRLKAGAVLVIDYGFPRAEYYHPQRTEGTLMGHYRHRSHADPFLWPGLSDLTAHVDFTAIAEAGVRAGLEVAGYASQAAFLLGCGLLDRLAESGEPATVPYLKETAAVTRLVSPAEMGELFKVLALARTPGIRWPGFSLADARHKL